MNIVTVFNYPDEDKYNNMFKIWLLSVLKHKTPNIKTIRILTKGLSQPIQRFIQWINCDDIVVVIGNTVDLHTSNPKAKHNIGFKLWNMCKETEPFIFVDADMIILSPFTEPVNASKDGYVIGVNHQTIPKHTEHIPFKFINTGFLIVPNPQFMNFEKILKTPLKYKCPGTDQMLIYNYLMTNQSTYTHRLVGYGWNSCAGYKRITDKGVWSDGIPETHPVHILHYWHEFKPWVRKCHIYDTYVDYVKNIDYTKTFDNVIKDSPSF